MARTRQDRQHQVAITLPWMNWCRRSRAEYEGAIRIPAGRRSAPPRGSRPARSRRAAHCCRPSALTAEVATPRGSALPPWRSSSAENAGLSFATHRYNLFGNRARVLLVCNHEDHDFCTLVDAWISRCCVNRGRRLVKCISSFQSAAWLAVDCKFVRPLDHVAKRMVARVPMPGTARPWLPI
jgi:hypothetical protein